MTTLEKLAGMFREGNITRREFLANASALGNSVRQIYRNEIMTRIKPFHGLFRHRFMLWASIPASSGVSDVYFFGGPTSNHNGQIGR